MISFGHFLSLSEEELNKVHRTSGGSKKFAVKVRNPSTKALRVHEQFI